MKSVKYLMTVKVEFTKKDAKINEEKLKDLLYYRFYDKHFDENIKKPMTKRKARPDTKPEWKLQDHTIEVSNITFRKKINARKFIDEISEKLGAEKCSQLKEESGVLSKQCEGEDVKIYFEIKVQKIKPQKAEKKEEEKKKE
ncbi:MAG: hypothetical protein RXQ80_00250 [Sulfolobaceae archaeon]|jgi:hypothetical protein|nr:hypothetical protein [Stygiolobus sp.]MDT7875789.1 hypothetical protein [Sulfolobaceae archaeon]